MRIAVAGGTGLIGRMVVESARRADHQTVVIARSEGIDLTTGVGLAPALEGADAVIDVTNLTTLSGRKATAFFETATGHLLRAAEDVGVTHHVALSIIGVDRVATGYYRAKRRQEELVLAGPVPATVLRATQFHEFASQLVDRGIGPLVPVPRMRSQPIAAREVAEALVRIATGAPQGLAPELAGPQVLAMVSMVRQVLQARAGRQVVVPVPIPGNVGRLMNADGLLPTGPGPRGTQTFAQWLAASTGPGALTDRRR